MFYKQLVIKTTIFLVILQGIAYAQIVNKPIFDTTSYLNKNKANEAFFIPLKVLYEDKLLPKGPDAPIDTNHLIRLARSLPSTSVPYILDIEAWKVKYHVDDYTAARSIDKYILVIDTMKKERPDLLFGYFGVPPIKAPITEKTPSKRVMNKWHHALERSMRLVAYVDIIAPEMYTYFNNKEAWTRYAKRIIKEARSYGKPIYPFIWSEFMDNTPLRGQFLPQDFWKHQIHFLNEYSDGIIIWGGRNYNYKKSKRREWDENAPWWIETKKLIQKNSNYPDPKPIKNTVKKPIPTTKQSDTKSLYFAPLPWLN